MSMVVEMSSKGGRVCPRRYRGGNGCPLIVRPTSEDVLTGNVFGILRHMRPSLWLRPMLNAAFATKRFTSCSMRGLDIAFWTRMAPPSVRMKIEDWSEPDVSISFHGTLVLLEAKYRSCLSTKTTRDGARDQVARLLDVAFHEARGEQFLGRMPFVAVLGVTATEPELVSRYRDPKVLAEALSHHRRFPGFDRMVNLLSCRLGYVSWERLANLLRNAMSRSCHLEALLLADLTEYLALKLKQASLSVEELGQRALPL